MSTCYIITKRIQIKQCTQVANKLVPLVSSLVQRRPGAAEGGRKRGGLRTGAGAGAELGGGVLEDDVGVLAGEELRVPQLPAPGDCRQGYMRKNQNSATSRDERDGLGRREARHL